MKRYLIICLMVISISTNSCISAEFAFSNSFTDLPNLFSSLQTNPNEIIAIATKDAEAGHEYAQLFLGSIYQDGNEVSEDFAKALFWYQKSAKQGNPYAMLSVGKFYHEGWVDNKKELVKALEIFNKLYAVSNENESLLISKYGLSGDDVKYLIKESAEYIADIYNNKSNQDLLAKWYNQNHVLSTTELDVEYAKWSIERGDSKNATYLILHLIEISEPSAKDLSQGFLKKFNRQPSYPPEIESYPKAIDEMLRNSRAFVKRNDELNPKNKTENKAIDFINNEAIKWLRIALNRGGDA